MPTNHEDEFKKALCYSGVSINLIPLSIVERLSFEKLTPSNMTLQMEDRTMTQPKGVLEDVLCNYGYGGRYTSFTAAWKTFPRHWSCLDRCEEKRTQSQSRRSKTLQLEQKPETS